MRGSPQINEDLSELISLLKSHHVEFIVVGSHALAFHGVPRFTEDIDFFIRRSEENISRLAEALAEFGIPVADNAKVEMLIKPRGVIFIGHKPNRADFLNFLDGVEFQDAWTRRLPGQLADVEVSFLSLSDYQATKEASGRAKDAADLVLLRATLARDA
ncbi:MAG: nucleotidyl transferase AbiEii/AbiGii toxin family protein [Fimbriimonadaceae bacterium]